MLIGQTYNIYDRNQISEQGNEAAHTPADIFHIFENREAKAGLDSTRQAATRVLGYLFFVGKAHQDSESVESGQNKKSELETV